MAGTNCFRVAPDRLPVLRITLPFRLIQSNMGNGLAFRDWILWACGQGSRPAAQLPGR
jgi:hypothetical protein